MFGVTKVIKKTFAPHFTFKKLCKVPPNVGGLRKRAACRRGKRIDKELSDFVTNGENNITKYCQETRLVIGKLNELNLKLLNTQVYVTNPSLNMCTFIDLITFNNVTETFVIVEIKRGCHYRLCSTKNGTLRFHAPDVTDCLFHQHQLQALLSKLLYEQNHLKDKCECCLIYVNDIECEHILEADFTSHVSEEALHDIKGLKRRSRKKHTK